MATHWNKRHDAQRLGAAQHAETPASKAPLRLAHRAFAVVASLTLSVGVAASGGFNPALAAPTPGSSATASPTPSKSAPTAPEASAPAAINSTSAGDDVRQREYWINDYKFPELWNQSTGRGRHPP